MTRIALLCSASVIVLTAGQVFAESPLPFMAGAANLKMNPASPGILYDQNSNFGYGIDSQNFSSSFASFYDSVGADDFIIPAGHKWKITEVDVAGMYFNGSGPARSEVVTFYSNNKGHPGKTRATYTVNCTDTAGSFACNLPGQGQSLSGGTNGRRYWVSVVANCDFTTCGQWGWIQNTTTHNDPGQWENPGDGFHTGCTTWTDTSTCTGLSSDDYAFDLKGKDR